MRNDREVILGDSYFFYIENMTLETSFFKCNMFNNNKQYKKHTN